MVSRESVALSRRVAKLMGTRVIQALSAEKRSRFVNAVMEADGFAALPGWVKRLVLAAEQERP